MRWVSAVAMVLACGSCQPLPDATATGQPSPAPPASQAGTPQPSATPPPCSSYTVPVTVGGVQQQATVEACQQADGSWRITQTTPGLPPQVYEVPPPAASPYSYSPGEGYAYPDYFPYWWGGPYWWGEPWFFGLGPSIFVVQRFNRFHGFHHGFAHGFGHGFARGFGHGFGHGFAAHGGGMAGGHR
jgi:hypothetical protein